MNLSDPRSPISIRGFPIRLLSVIIRFIISSFLELIDLFGSRENEVKVWIFDSLFFLASKQGLNWFDFCLVPDKMRENWGLDFWFDFCLVFGFQIFCCNLVWLARNVGYGLPWIWVHVKLDIGSCYENLGSGEYWNWGINHLLCEDDSISEEYLVDSLHLNMWGLLRNYMMNED